MILQDFYIGKTCVQICVHSVQILRRIVLHLLPSRYQFESSQWEKELKTLRDEQKQQYHEWLHNIDEDPERSM